MRSTGADRISQVVTYGVIKAKQSLKDSSRVMGYPYAVGDRLTKAMPPSVQGKDISIKGIFNPDDERYRGGRGVPQAACRGPRRPEDR